MRIAKLTSDAQPDLVHVVNTRPLVHLDVNLRQVGQVDIGVRFVVANEETTLHERFPLDKQLSDLRPLRLADHLSLSIALLGIT